MAKRGKTWTSAAAPRPQRAKPRHPRASDPEKKKVVKLTRELAEARQQLAGAFEQQTATSEILRLVSSSRTDLQPVFESIVGNAARLCEAEFSGVARFDNGLLHLVAINNLSPEETAAFHSLFPRSPGRNFVMGRAFIDGRPVHFRDVLAELDYDARTREVLQRAAPSRMTRRLPLAGTSGPLHL
jgi:hypothetical protein